MVDMEMLDTLKHCGHHAGRVQWSSVEPSGAQWSSVERSSLSDVSRFYHFS